MFVSTATTITSRRRSRPSDLARTATREDSEHQHAPHCGPATCTSHEAVEPRGRDAGPPRRAHEEICRPYARGAWHVRVADRRSRSSSSSIQRTHTQQYGQAVWKCARVAYSSRTRRGAGRGPWIWRGRSKARGRGRRSLARGQDREGQAQEHLQRRLVSRRRRHHLRVGRGVHATRAEPAHQGIRSSTTRRP
jgi:hypothetical protein